jgi:hypothetical protein
MINGSISRISSIIRLKTACGTRFVKASATVIAHAERGM